jgi:hypothetical protein
MEPYFLLHGHALSIGEFHTIEQQVNNVKNIGNISYIMFFVGNLCEHMIPQKMMINVILWWLIGWFIVHINLHLINILFVTVWGDFKHN